MVVGEISQEIELDKAIHADIGILLQYVWHKHVSAFVYAYVVIADTLDATGRWLASPPIFRLVDIGQDPPWDLLAIFLPILAILPHTLLLIPHLAMNK